MRRRGVFVIAVAAVLCAAFARAEELGPAMPSAPAAIETAPPDAPIVVRQEDAEALLRSLPQRPQEPPPPERGVTREFTADVPPKPVVNPTSRFVFEDATDRPAVPVKPLSEREAAVEAVRQSVRGTGNTAP